MSQNKNVHHPAEREPSPEGGLDFLVGSSKESPEKAVHAGADLGVPSSRFPGASDHATEEVNSAQTQVHIYPLPQAHGPSRKKWVERF